MKIKIVFDWGLCNLCKDKECNEIQNCSYLSLFKFGFYTIMIGFMLLMLKIYFDLIVFIEKISGIMMWAGLVIIWLVVIKKRMIPDINKHLEKNKTFDELYS